MLRYVGSHLYISTRKVGTAFAAPTFFVEIIYPSRFAAAPVGRRGAYSPNPLRRSAPSFTVPVAEPAEAPGSLELYPMPG